ncbi:hypothetical protein ACIQD3_03735 [Peribacillus loiseleuriae]|uniref:hypothetical protein n=1 Tax=Peribacillus loiseleuriae TaxID=1679170 RepID=UPI00381D2A46
MTKFTLNQKMDDVVRYQNGIESAKSLGANYEVVRMWVKRFEYHGISAFEKAIQLIQWNYIT